MTIEELEPLAETEHEGHLKSDQQGDVLEQGGTDALNSLLTAALHKHTSKKHRKKDVACSKADLREKQLPTITGPNAESPTSQNLDERNVQENSGQVLGITLHCCDRLEGSPVLFPHPVVQVHVCNSDTGKWLQKSAKDRKVTSYYEGSEVDYILPIMTQPFDMKRNRSLCCHWNEQLIFNESTEHFITEKPLVIIFFQLMDFSSSSISSGISGNQSQNSSTHGWVTLAWAFLKIRGSNNHINIGNKLRLQLWRPRKSTTVNLTDLYSWWKSGSRNKYSSSLLVSLQEIVIPQSPQPALRSMLVTQQEYGGETMPENLLGDLSGGDSYSSPSVNVQKSLVDWDRKPNQSCKILNNVKHCLLHADEGCMVVKFSHSGLKLACGAKKQILIYEVLTGKLEFIFSGHLGLIYDICWSESDRLLLSASGDSTARIWNVEPGEKCGSSQTLTHPSHVYAARFVPFKPQVFVSGGFDHVIRVWLCNDSGTSYRNIQELTNHLAFVNALCFNLEGDMLYSGDKQGVILAWNVKVPKKMHGKKKLIILSLQLEVKINDIMGKVINSISYHPGGFRILVHTRDSQLRLVNHKHWTVTHRLTGILNVREQLRGCISPCGTWVISGSEDHGVYVWHSDTGELMSAFLNLPLKGTVSCVDFHPHDNMMAVCSYSRQTPILILAYNNQDKSPATITLPTTSVQPDNPFSLSCSIMRSPSHSHMYSEYEESPNKNFQTEPPVLPKSSFSAFSQNLQEPSAKKLQDSDHIKQTTKDIGHLDAREMGQDVGSKILSDLDNILKMACDDPLSMDNTNIINDRLELKPIGRLATVIYDYEGTEPDELSVKQGDYVMIIKSENEEWWQVRTADMKLSGLVPAAYLKHLPQQQHEQLDWMDTGKIIAVPSGSGELSFICDTEGTPSKARSRRHKAKTGPVKKITSTPKNKY